MSSAPLIFDHVAYELIFLHAARFGEYQVDGVLLGIIRENGDRVVKETFPLFHGPGPLAPMLELAFTLVLFLPLSF